MTSFLPHRIPKRLFSAILHTSCVICGLLVWALCLCAGAVIVGIQSPWRNVTSYHINIAQAQLFCNFSYSLINIERYCLKQKQPLPGSWALLGLCWINHLRESFLSNVVMGLITRFLLWNKASQSLCCFFLNSASGCGQMQKRVHARVGCLFNDTRVFD